MPVLTSFYQYSCAVLSRVTMLCGLERWKHVTSWSFKPGSYRLARKQLAELVMVAQQLCECTTALLLLVILLIITGNKAGTVNAQTDWVYELQWQPLIMTGLQHHVE